MVSGFLKRIKESPHFPQLIILVTFLVSFTFIRTVTILQRESLIPILDLPGLFHIHHMVFGIIIILIAGYIGISFWDNKNLRFLASALFGFGAALTIDEFALWLFLDDVYWEREGRISVDAVITTEALFLIGYLISEIHDHSWIKKIPLKKKLVSKLKESE
jgi:hypothetical protein